MIRWSEDDGAGYKILGSRVRKLFLGRLPFSLCHVVRCRHELRELGIGDISLIHPETVDIDTMHGPGVFGCPHPDLIVLHAGRILRAHGKLSPRNPGHPCGRLAGNGRGIRHRRLEHDLGRSHVIRVICGVGCHTLRGRKRCRRRRFYRRVDYVAVRIQLPDDHGRDRCQRQCYDQQRPYSLCV